MFSVLKKQVQDNFKKLSAEQTLFYVNIDRDEIWNQYLSGFDETHRQHHNCNCCKSFLRQYGGIVAIIGNNMVSIWDNITAPMEFVGSVVNLSTYIHSLPITDVFMNDVVKCGTNKNLGSAGVVWEHFYIELDEKFIQRADSIDSIKSEKRADKDVLKRSLDDLTIDACETVLELIAQKSLYRGNEFEELVKSFKGLLEEYTSLDADIEDNYCWIQSTKLHQSVCRIRNSAIGKLLVDLSEGKGLDAAVGSFEARVAPTNYKRPTALVTPKMVEEAKQKLIDMGLMNSLDRRYANVSDLNTENILFTDKSSELKDVFGEIAKDTLVNPKTLSKVEEVTVEEFMTKILPTSKSVELLVENNHLGNLTSLLTAQDKNAPSLFKWDNPFSWSYTGGITDSMKERVKAAGGKVDGVLRFSIQWNEDGKSIIDLDAHAHEPNGTHIYYGSYNKERGSSLTTMSGNLDVDMRSPTTIGIENITWLDRARMGEGKYGFVIHNFSGHTRFNGVRAEIEFDGALYEFAYNKAFIGTLNIAEVTYSKRSGFSIKPLLDSKSSVSSTEKWGVKTNQFTKVKQIMLSPNHWEAPRGNKHYFFILENCVSDETPRPFFNEFLKDEFTENRKVFEILGSKVKVPETKQQLSGIGFSDTQKNSVIARVEGTFKRNIKINF